MGLILCLETATKSCSISLALNGEELKTITEESGEYSHSEKLNGFIESIFNDTPYQLKDLNAIAVSEGPGSYTGLRIGTSTAKGLCFALDIPLIAINSLASLVQLKTIEKGFVCPMFDARRMEVYSALFDVNNKCVEETNAVIINNESYLQFLDQNTVVFIGPGAEKCKAEINHPNAIFDLDIKVSASGMIAIAFDKFNCGKIEDLAYFEPFYLKDFIAGSPKKIF